MGSPSASVRSVETESEAVEALKAWKPYSLHVVTLDGLERDVAISSRRNRWKVAAQILAGMPWSTIEARDRKGAIVGILQREESVDQAEDVDDEPDRSAVSIREAQLLELVLKAQKVALEGQTSVLKPFLDSTTRLIAAMTDRVTRLEDELYQRASELRRLMANASDGDDSESKGGLMSTEMIGMLLRLASGGGGLGGGGGPTRPPPATSAEPPRKRQAPPGAPKGSTVVGQPPPGAKDAGGGGGGSGSGTAAAG